MIPEEIVRLVSYHLTGLPFVRLTPTERTIVNCLIHEGYLIVDERGDVKPGPKMEL